MLRLFRSAEPTPTAFEIHHSGQMHRITLKRVRNARRYTLRVRAASRDVVLSMPWRGSVGAARDFAERHRVWITTRLSRLPDVVAFTPGAVIPLRGLEHVIERGTIGPGPVWAETRSSCPGPAFALRVSGGEPHIPRRVTDYLRGEARRDLAACVARHARSLGLAPRSLTIRDTTSRWGSCSADGALNFSWRLILAPSFVLDYLAAHEVCHLVHMDHSERFWALTHRLSPETPRAEAWLKSQGSSLHRYGGSPPADSTDNL